MKECIICERTIFGTSDSICALCHARKDFEVIQVKFNRGEVTQELYAYYLDTLNKLLKG